MSDITEEVLKNLTMMSKANFYKMSNLTHKAQNLIKELMKLRSLERSFRELIRYLSMQIFLMSIKKKFQQI